MRNCLSSYIQWYKVFVHWKLKLLNFMMDSVLKHFTPCYTFNVFFTSFVHFKSFYTSLFYCIHLNFLILFPVTLDMYFYLMNNKDTSLFMPYVGSVCIGSLPCSEKFFSGEFLQSMKREYWALILSIGKINGHW